MTTLIFIGGMVVGAIIMLIFVFSLLKDANHRYEKADKRWEEGSAEYRKAVQVLETNRTEREESSKVIGDVLNNVLAIVKNVDATDELTEAIQELEALVPIFKR